MNITICTKHFSANGGQERFCVRLASFLAGRGHKVKVLAVSGAPIAGVDLRIIPTPAIIPRSARDWMYGKILARAMVSHSADVSFGDQKTWGCSVIRPGGGAERQYWRRRLFNQRNRINPGVMRPGMLIKMYFDMRAEANGYNSDKLKCVIANSRMVRNGLLDSFPGLSGKVEVVYNGADIDRFTPDNADKWRRETAAGIGLNPDCLTGVFVANNFALKGLRQAIETIAGLTNGGKHSVQLIIAGGGRSKRYAQLIRKKGLQDFVRFTGQSEEMERYYAAADFLLFPTFYDPCANVTLEALAAGLPVITTKMNGAHELLDDRHGCVVDQPCEVGAMADFIIGLKDKNRLAKMKVAARTLAEQHKIAAKLTRIEKILENNGC